MEESERRCPKCESTMEDGFIIDYGHYRQDQSRWIEGPPQRGLLTNATTFNKRGYSVSTYRCVGCGYLESFAGTQDPAPAEEPTECLECSTPIPPESKECPSCGWSFDPDARGTGRQS